MFNYSTRTKYLCYNISPRRYCNKLRSQNDVVPKSYTGLSQSRKDLVDRNNVPPVFNTFYKTPLNLHKGHMQWLFDEHGKKYLDFFGGIVTVSVGHCHPKVVGAMNEQINTLWHTTSLYRHPKLYEYLDRLATKLPKKLEVIYLVNSGTNASDLATILAKSYTRNNDVISLQKCYHGHSTTMMALSGMRLFRVPIPVQSGFHHAVIPDPYRGIWTGCRDSLSQVRDSCSCPGDCNATDKYVGLLEELLESSVPSGGVAAFFAESIQGASGIIQFPKGYLLKAQELIKKNGGLFIADEVQTGFGRTGDAYWGFESHGLVPDIVTIAKGIGNGFPLAAVVTTREIATAHDFYFNTFGGNPLACAAGNAVLQVIDEEGMQENSKVLGKYLIEQLMELQKVHPVIGDVRGKGLMLGVDLVVPGTKTPVSKEYLSELHERVKDLGILIGFGGMSANIIRLTPPMCINKGDVDFLLSTLDKTFKLLSKIY